MCTKKCKIKFNMRFIIFDIDKCNILIYIVCREKNMKVSTKIKIFCYNTKIESLRTELRFSKNMLTYLNLEHEKLLKEIRKHDNEYCFYQDIKNIQNSLNAPQKYQIRYSHISSILLCEKEQDKYTKNIENIERSLEKLKNKISNTTKRHLLEIF